MVGRFDQESGYFRERADDSVWTVPPPAVGLDSPRIWFPEKQTDSDTDDDEEDWDQHELDDADRVLSRHIPRQWTRPEPE